MATEPEETERMTFTLSKALDARLRDISMILGKKPTDMCLIATEKYLDAIEKNAGDAFNDARKAIAVVRNLE